MIGNLRLKTDKVGQVSAQAPPSFSYLKIRSGAGREISQRPTSLSSGSFQVSRASELALLWGQDQQDANSYISVIIGKNSQGKTIDHVSASKVQL